MPFILNWPSARVNHMAGWSSLNGGRFRVVGWAASGLGALGGMALFTAACS